MESLSEVRHSMLPAHSRVTGCMATSQPTHTQSPAAARGRRAVLCPRHRLSSSAPAGLYLPDNADPRRQPDHPYRLLGREPVDPGGSRSSSQTTLSYKSNCWVNLHPLCRQGSSQKGSTRSPRLELRQHLQRLSPIHKVIKLNCSSLSSVNIC